MRKKIPLILGILFALIALVLIKIYTGQQREQVMGEAGKRIKEIQENQTAVLVARQEIPKGGTVGKDSIDVRIVPKQFVQPQAVTSLDRVAGMVAMLPIAKGEQITLSKLSSSKAESFEGGGALAMTTPIGKRAITISLDPVSAVGGMLLPGNYVDISVMLDIPVAMPDGKQGKQPAIIPLLQNVLVLAVGQQTSVPQQQPQDSRYSKKEEKKESSPSITLALAPQEANILAFAQEHGKIRLSLRSPSDARIEKVSPASWDTLLQYVYPPEAKEQVKHKEESDTGPYIEIYRGLNKEKIPLTGENTRSR